MLIVFNVFRYTFSTLSADHHHHTYSENRPLQTAIWKAHQLQFDELVESRNIRRITGQPPHTGTNPVVVRKTYQWIGGENTPHFDIDLLIKAGLTPAEALDYIYAEHMFGGPYDWAEKRGVSRQAISQNVKRAKDKLKGEFPR